MLDESSLRYTLIQIQMRKMANIDSLFSSNIFFRITTIHYGRNDRHVEFFQHSVECGPFFFLLLVLFDHFVSLVISFSVTSFSDHLITITFL